MKRRRTTALRIHRLLHCIALHCTQHQRQSNNVPVYIFHSTLYFTKLNPYSGLFARVDMQIFIKVHQKVLMLSMQKNSSMLSSLLFSFAFPVLVLWHFSSSIYNRFSILFSYFFSLASHAEQIKIQLSFCSRFTLITSSIRFCVVHCTLQPFVVRSVEWNFKWKHR